MSSDPIQTRSRKAATSRAIRMARNGNKCETHAEPTESTIGEPMMPAVWKEQLSSRDCPIRMLRLNQVIDATGLRKSKIYELQAEGNFPMRLKITSRAVGWIEAEVQAWLAQRQSHLHTTASHRG